MNYQLINHAYVNEVQGISQIFFPNEGFARVLGPVESGYTLLSAFDEGRIKSSLFLDGKKIASDDRAPEAEGEKALKNGIQKGIFAVCRSAVPIRTPWGLMVGIRPTKIIHELWEKGYDDQEVRSYFHSFYLAEPEKTELCLKVAGAEERILRQAQDRDSLSLYIGIPFCVSRCLYCSFSSYTVKQYKKQLDAYLSALAKELAAVKGYIGNRTIQSLYIGGGTPTALNSTQFARLMAMVAELYDTARISEFTVEAGRPDTINRDKLRHMKEAGVSRISINPQTLNEQTLAEIGRRHTVEEFYRAFAMARQEGFDNMNLDLILGLPGESCRHAQKTLEGITHLSPENVTVHTLAVKRASRLKERLDEISLTRADEIGRMLTLAQQHLQAMGLTPYYMYRQKNILGNYENVGYCKPGREGLYNIQIIEERQTIIAVGAGAATKHVDRGRNLVRRIYNVKTPEEYIGRIDEMIERKEKLYEYDSESAEGHKGFVREGSAPVAED